MLADLHTIKGLGELEKFDRHASTSRTPIQTFVLPTKFTHEVSQGSSYRWTLRIPRLRLASA